MDTTTGFRASNRSRNHLDGLSNERVNWLYRGKKRLDEILNIGILELFLLVEPQPAMLG